MKFIGIYFIYLLTLIGSCNTIEEFERGFNLYTKGEYENAIKVFEKNLNSKYLDVRCFVGKAYCQYELLAFNQAKSNLSKALEMLGTVNNEGHKLWIEGHSYKLLGEIASLENDANSMIEYYNKAVVILKDDSELISNIGYTCIENGDLQKGIDFLSKAIEINSSDAYAYNNRALGYIRQNKLGLAEVDLAKSQFLEPDNPFLLKNYGYFFLKKNNKNKACEYFKLSIKVQYSDWWDKAELDKINQAIANHCTD